MKRFYTIISVLILAALACNLQTAQDQGIGNASTAAAATIAAKLTESAQPNPITNTPNIVSQPTGTVTATPPPSSTPQLTATVTPLPCNLATFVNDVTYPDGTEITVNQSFTKVWRFKNIGTCTWTSGYQLVFDHGDQMSGPASQPLTGGTVAPGQTVDISVDLVAPSPHGTYRGYWRMRDSSGVLFALTTGSFWVEIKSVNAPSPTKTATLPALPPPAVAATVDVPMVAGQSGMVESDGTVLSVTNAGDSDSNVSLQAFVSFDISGIPSGVTISDVKFNFSNYDTLGNPFGGLGCLRMYQQDYGSLDAGDYFGGSPLGAYGRWCSTGELNSVTAGSSDLVALFQGALGNPRIRFRFQFNEHATNSNGSADAVRLGSGIKFIVSYHSP